MKDFDSERVATTEEQRRFKIRGEEFTRRESVRPEATADFEDIVPGTGAHKTLEIIDRMILDFIEDDGAHARYLALRERVENALTLDDMIALANWITSEVVGRPTGSPSDSSNGSEGEVTGTPSTGGSSLQVGLASAA